MTDAQKNSGHRALRKGRSSQPGQIYHVTTTTLSRVPFFSGYLAAHAAVCCFDERILLGDAQMLAWVLMPDHAHWLIQLGKEKSLPALVNVLKAFSARNANRALLRHGPIWARGFHDRAIRHEQDITDVAQYIIANPLRAGLVQHANEYPFSSARRSALQGATGHPTQRIAP